VLLKSHSIKCRLSRVACHLGLAFDCCCVALSQTMPFVTLATCNLQLFVTATISNSSQLVNIYPFDKLFQLKKCLIFSDLLDFGEIGLTKVKLNDITNMK
jgi:hypothetical protein